MSKKVYILHGWSYSTEKWQPFLDLLKKHGFQIVMLEIPGLTAPLNEVWTLEDYVEWLKKNLAKEKEMIILLGHSNGGRIALAFVAKYPDNVEKLFLIDSAGIYHNELPLRMKRQIFGLLSKAGKQFTTSSKIRSLLYKFVREHDYEKADPKLRETMRNLITSDITPLLQKVKIPTVIIWGKQDTITPVQDAQIMKDEIKNASLFEIDGARHSPQFTHAEKLVTIITSEK